MGITGPKYKYIKIYNYINYVLCYDTCSSCNIGGNEENQNCTSCKDSKFLLESNGNSVDKCPEDTKLDEKINKSVKENKSSNKYIYIIVGISSLIIILLIIFIIYIKIRRKIREKKPEKEKIIKEMNSGGLLSEE